MSDKTGETKEDILSYCITYSLIRPYNELKEYQDKRMDILYPDIPDETADVTNIKLVSPLM